jgi:predicted ester cyclase
MKTTLAGTAAAAAVNEATEVIRAFYAIVDDVTQPIDVLQRFFAPTFKDHNRPARAPSGAPDSAVSLNLFAELRTGFPDMRHSLDILAPIRDDKAVVYWTFTGTHRNAFFDVPASGNKVRINGVDIFRVADGAFVEQWHVEELMSLFAQLDADN